MTQPPIIVFRCPGCNEAFSSLDWRDPQKAFEAHRNYGPARCRR
jgi:hypothetical protein